MAHWGLLRCELNWAYDRVVDGGSLTWSYTPHPTPAWLIRKGRVTLEFADGVESYEEGTWLFPRQAPGNQTFSKGTHILSVRFHAEWPNGSPIFPRRVTHAFAAESIPALTPAAEALVQHVAGRFEQLGRQADLHGSLEEYFNLQPFLFRWIAAYYTTLTQQGVQPATLSHLHEKLRMAIEYLNSHPTSEPLREEKLARQVGLSVSQLNKIFAREAGASPTDFWNERRLRIARSRLLSPGESVKAIAYDLGFSAPANFSHWFRSHTGQSPRDYRHVNAAAPLV